MSLQVGVQSKDATGVPELEGGRCLLGGPHAREAGPLKAKNDEGITESLVKAIPAWKPCCSSSMSSQFVAEFELCS